MRIWGIGSAALLLALVGACNGSEPAPSPTPSPAVSSPSVSPSPSASPDPAAQAVAAVRAYYAEVNRAASTGQVATLRAMVKPECSCARLVGYIGERWSAGSIRGAVFTVEQLQPDRAMPSSATVKIIYTVSRYEVLDRAGRVVETVAAVPRTTAEVTLVREGERWLVREVLGLGPAPRPSASAS